MVKFDIEVYNKNGDLFISYGAVLKYWLADGWLQIRGTEKFYYLNINEISRFTVKEI